MVNKVHIALDQAHEHAAALGRLLGHWAFLEILLRVLMQHLLGLDPQKADIVYNKIISLNAKLSLFKTINNKFTKDQSLKKEINKLLKSIEDLNKTRNDFVHSAWAGHSQDIIKIENSLLRNDKSKPEKYKNKTIPKYKKKFTPQDIQDVVEKIAKLSRSLSDLLIRISEAPLTQS